MKILLLAALCFTGEVKAQNTLTSDLVEGGKTIVDLIRVIKSPRTTITSVAYSNSDSCGSKKLSDICFKNKTDKTIQVSLYLRTGNVYEIKPL